MSGQGRDHRRVCTTVPGHEPVVTAAPTLATSKQGARGVPHTTMLRCTCGWHGGQVSTLSPGNGGRARPAMQAHKRHVGHVLAGVDDRPGVPWWLTVEQAIAEARRGGALLGEYAHAAAASRPAASILAQDHPAVR